MANVTVQVLEGLERGRVFQDLPTPITIGREDDNSIRLNDERVSRFHAKIQDDGNREILTDLESTNGTRVNGHPVQLRVLQPGDQVSIGRCLLLYGSTEQIASHVAGLNLQADSVVAEAAEADLDEPADSLRSVTEDGSLGELFAAGPPTIPDGLGLLQRAQMSDMVSFAHDQIRSVLEAAAEENPEEQSSVMRVDWLAWQKLVQLEMHLATWLRRIADPDA